MFHIFTILRNPSFCSSVLNICTVRGISKHLNWSSLQHPGIIEFVFYLNAQPWDLDPYSFDSWVQRANFWAATYYFYIDGTLFILCHVLRHSVKERQQNCLVTSHGVYRTVTSTIKIHSLSIRFKNSFKKIINSHHTLLKKKPDLRSFSTIIIVNAIYQTSLVYDPVSWSPYSMVINWRRRSRD